MASATGIGTATATGVGGRTVVDKIVARVSQCAARCSLRSSPKRCLSTVARSLLGGGDDCSAASIDEILSPSRWQRLFVGVTVVEVEVLDVDVVVLEMLDVEVVVLLMLDVVDDGVVVVVVEVAIVVVVGGVVSVSVFESLLPAVASVAVIVSGPGVVEAFRCVNATPLLLVVT